MRSVQSSESIIRDIVRSIRERDFIAFTKWCRIENKQGKTISINFENWHWEQQQFQRNRTGKDIILKARQVGFSTLELLRDLFFALSNPNSNVIVVATDNKLAKDFLDRIKRFYKSLSELTTQLGAPTMFPSLTDKSLGLRNQRQEITLTNGSTIKTLSAGSREENAKDTGRGSTIHRLHISEVAFWKYPTETITTLMGGLIPNAEVVIESTPNGVGDWFYNEIQASQQNKSPYKFHFFPWFEHAENKMKLFDGEKIFPQTEDERKLVADKGISLEQLKWYQEKRRELKSIEKLLTEHPNDSQSCFVSSGNMFINANMRGYMETKIVAPIDVEEIQLGQEFRDLIVYEKPIPNNSYIIASDVSSGDGGDDSTIVIINSDTGNIAATYANAFIDPVALAMNVHSLAERYNYGMIVVEQNNWGLSTLTTLRDSEYSNMYQGEFSGDYDGWLTSQKSRDIMFSFLYSQIQDQEMSNISRELASQLYILARNNKGKIQAQGKSNHSKKTEDEPKDDLIFAFAIAWYVRKEMFGSRYINSETGMVWSTSRDFGAGSIAGFI